jgi:hypothetical protein
MILVAFVSAHNAECYVLAQQILLVSLRSIGIKPSTEILEHSISVGLSFSSF